ncbi:MAG: transposase, partial [bacterium]|nr:transposase [bacterium]
QDIEPDPNGDGKRIIDGTSRDRQISVSDPDMRHGRKSKTKTINGYKGHIARDLDHGMILDALVLPANQKEYVAADMMRPYLESYAPVSELQIDRGYLSAAWVVDLYESDDAAVYSKPWNPTNKGLFPKSTFAIDLDAGIVTCPANEVATIPASTRRKDARRQVCFSGCTDCVLKPKCTKSKRGRSVVIHENEALLQHLAAEKATPEGRAKLRERTAIEHGLAHVRTYQPKKARYRGTRKNTFGMRRAAAVVNLQTIDRELRVAANRSPTDQELRLAS